MKKLTLNLDDLEVASFEVASDEMTERGTVEGHALPSTESLRDYLYSWLLACNN